MALHRHLYFQHSFVYFACENHLMINKVFWRIVTQWLKPLFLSLTTNPMVNQDPLESQPVHRPSIFSSEIAERVYENTNCTDLLSARKMSVDTGADPGFFLGGGALVSCTTSTPINHIVFFFCRIPVVLENRRSSQGGAHPLHPPPRSAPEIGYQNIFFSCASKLGTGRNIVHENTLIINFSEVQLTYCSSKKNIYNSTIL